jgi:Orsellinic acid/F9775 biosynthesis cluster protein D
MYVTHYKQLKVVIELGEHEISERDTMDGIESEVAKHIPIIIDRLYNLVVCRDCGIGIPFEWVMGHLTHNHGIRKSEQDIRRELNVDQEPMTVEEATEWIKTVWVARSVQGIPVHEGLKCTVCEYSVKAISGMKNHFTEEHKGLKRAENTVKCKVQLVFKGGLQKYIQVEELEDMEVDFDREPEWVVAVNREFNDSMANVKVAGGKGKANLRLMNAFIAKTRWDSLVEGMDLQEIVKVTSMPSINHALHKVILCGRRYIHTACKELDKGSIIVKRLLMSQG